MGTAWRTAGWILLGASLILALSLGIRHGFGLFLAPMSSDFGWGREVFAICPVKSLSCLVCSMSNRS